MNRIEITTSPEDALPVVTLYHPVWDGVEISCQDIALRCADDVRRCAEIVTDQLDGAFDGLPVIDRRRNV